MAIVLDETFTGTDGTELSIHNPLWNKITGFTDDIIIQTNRAQIVNSLQFTGYLYSQNMTPDYTVESDAVVSSVNPTSVELGVTGRTSISSQTYYSVVIRTAQIDLRRVLNGVTTQLGFFSIPGGLVAGTHRIKLEMIGSLIRAYYNSTLRISTNDSNITDGGYAGIHGRAGSGATRLQWDNVKVDGVIANSRIIIPSGGITFGGTGSQIDFRDPDHVIPAGGIILFSGTGNQANTSVPPYIIDPEGGIVFSGTGNILNEKSPPHVIPTSGGIVFGGNNNMLFNFVPPIGGPRMPLTGVGL